MFVELTGMDGERIMLNLAHVAYIGPNPDNVHTNISFVGEPDNAFIVKQTYAQIKKLIMEATK